MDERQAVRDDNELKRKVLGFSDNRQDAALQAGHFNDFVFVSLLRAAIYSALRSAGSNGLDDGRIGEAIQAALGFRKEERATLREWLNSDKLEGPLLLDAERTLREVLAHRFWVDQQRGWRVTDTNLERLHLLRAEYKGHDDLVANESKFVRAHPILKSASPDRRRRAFTVLFDHMRKGLAVDTRKPRPTAARRCPAQGRQSPEGVEAFGGQAPRRVRPDPGPHCAADASRRGSLSHPRWRNLCSRPLATRQPHLGNAAKPQGLRPDRPRNAGGRRGQHHPQAVSFLPRDRRQLDALRERDPIQGRRRRGGRG
jgi:hypothetical protein